MLRTIPIFLLTLVLTACMIPAQAQVFTLDKCLDDLAEKQSLGPVVAVMHGPAPGTADLSSLEGLAKTFGLKLFEQDGIHVLGPEQSIYFYDLSSYFPKEQPKQALRPGDRFLQSLTPEQLKMVGSRDGLHFADLTDKQQALARTMFTGRITLLKRTGTPPSAEEIIPPPPTLGSDGEILPAPSLPDSPRNTEEITLSSLPVEDITITGLLAYGALAEGDSMEYECDLGGPDVPLWDPAEHDLVVAPEPESTLPKAPKPIGPNTLKPSQLDYDRPELRKQIDFPVRTSLKDIVGLAASESGLPLLVGPGSEQVLLYVKAGGQSIGQVLKAVSLATGGTWRKVGEMFVYALDVTGLGSFQRRAADLDDLANEAELPAEVPFDALRVRDVMLNLPVIPGTTFSLTPQQVTDLTAALEVNPSMDVCRVPWGALTPQQQALALSECPALKNAKVDQLYVNLQVSAEISFHFPSVGNAGAGFMPAKHQLIMHLLPPPSKPAFSPEFEPRVWPKGAKVPMPSGMRGLLYKVSGSDTPAGVAASARRYGFNTLLVRMFADGYAIFPSAQFPRLPGLKADDFLRNLIAVAHAQGIKIVGVIDVLRWSDGDPKHWLYKSPELIDRDIAGRMSTEWMAKRTVGPEEAMQQRMWYGDAFDGDFVSPFQPLVRQKLSALVGELATYDLDGLAFDHTSILCPARDHETGCPSGGQTGFNDLARSAFIRTTGVDPVDIAGESVVRRLLPMPLAPVAASASSMRKTWAEFYRTACDALLDILLEAGKKAKPGVPLWVVDTYRDGIMMNAVDSHNWDEFHGRIDTVVGWSAVDDPEYAGKGTKTIQLVRVSDPVAPLFLASYIAIIQGKSFAGMLSEDDVISPPETPIKDIILDFACSKTRKTEFLKLLETVRPAKTP